MNSLNNSATVGKIDQHKVVQMAFLGTVGATANEIIHIVGMILEIAE